ncbi:hypothetical protein NGA_0612700 [Nannochloropsis gaditana CCMP526]|uniref:uncharacterized protein n=1 Tax=Nannochloropsis gaditana (strain CCMP526) TaxID=1093141 RepID=UPI00029F795F|nr:hypothetical protein NGA_0612700 [Nannochloropsis gaditana CCMP526]EKU20745.1 hypothetical protein NGA_0612700 [Nannochloropsis gaditana CCMP526]|eukprot:XP_005855614.1 hypothetical protein NGA_0612700 [Nannochloropsis gaditana CCMP526]
MHTSDASRCVVSPPLADPDQRIVNTRLLVEQELAIARLARHHISPPDSWTDPHAVALTLAAVQVLTEEAKEKGIKLKKQLPVMFIETQETSKESDFGPARHTSTWTRLPETLATGLPSRVLRRGAAELNLRLQAYEKELEKVEAHLKKTAREAEVLEKLAPLLTVERDPGWLLEKARQKVESLLQQHGRIMTQEEAEEANLIAARARRTGVSL